MDDIQQQVNEEEIAICSIIKLKKFGHLMNHGTNIQKHK